MELLNLIFAAAIVGVIAAAFAGTLFFLIEQKRPILRGDDKFTEYFRRMMFCVWVTSALLYIALTYWWTT